MLGVVLANSHPATENIDLLPGGAAANLQNLQFAGIIKGAILLLLIVAAIIFFIILIVGGIRWLTSGGDKTKTEGARNQITAALVGLVIIFAAWAIARLVEEFFGFRIIGGNLEFPNAGFVAPAPGGGGGGGGGQL